MDEGLSSQLRLIHPWHSAHGMGPAVLQWQSLGLEQRQYVRLFVVIGTIGWDCALITVVIRTASRRDVDASSSFIFQVFV